jgi:hypothetical protein
MDNKITELTVKVEGKEYTYKDFKTLILINDEMSMSFIDGGAIGLIVALARMQIEANKLLNALQEDYNLNLSEIKKFVAISMEEIEELKVDKE